MRVQHDFRKNESKILTKDISFHCKCKFDSRKYNSSQMWNNDECWWQCKKHHVCEKGYIKSPAACSCKTGKYLASIIHKSMITRDDAEAKTIEAETKTIPADFNEKVITCKTQNFYVLLAFLSISLVLLIGVSIYCYLKKYWVKQKHLLPFHVTNDKLINEKLINVL